MILQQPELSEVAKTDYFDASYPCHLYFVCRRPRISLNVDKFEVTEEFIEFVINVHHNENINEYNVKISNDFDSTNVTLKSSYPYNKFKLYVNDILILDAKLAIFLQSIPRFYTEADYLDMEVLYIGQSYGVEGARTAPDRLKSHSTLQGIYAEAMTNNPDSEIWLALASFEEILITIMNGRLNWTQSELDADNIRRPGIMNRVLNQGLNEQQKINFTEAALIRYFQPPYNKIYKDSFPNPAHSTYSECYEIDINSIVIELQTCEILNCNFFSEVIDRKPYHSATFFLHSLKERMDMFDITKWKKE